MRVLIVDDSMVFRTQIKSAIEKDPSIQVVATAPNGKMALEKLKKEKIDLVTLDLEMPELDGISTVKEMRKMGLTHKVILFSSYTVEGSEKTLQALSAGADDFLTKPSGENLSFENAAATIAKTLIPKIKQFTSRVKAATAPSTTTPITPPLEGHPKTANALPKYIKKSIYTFIPEVIVIGSSTGGPAALEEVFRNLKGPLRVPILIAQHMPPLFTASLAQNLMKLTGIEAKEGAHMETLENNRIYVAPGDYHMSIVDQAGIKKIKLDQNPPRNMVRPAVDFLFESASELYRDKTLGIVLTGMGEDGKDGAMLIKENKGGMVIQSEKSCVVFGMPGAVHQVGAYDQIGDLGEIGSILKKCSQ